MVQTTIIAAARTIAIPTRRYDVLTEAGVELIVHWTDAFDMTLGFLKLKTYELSAGTFQFPLPVWPGWLT